MQRLSFSTIRHRFTRCTALLLALLMILEATGVSYAQIPATISYQGVLTDSNGAVVPDGAHKLFFAIYDAGGTALWTERHADVLVSGGIFHVILGSIDSLALLPFDQPYTLGITVNDGPELAPRLPFTAVPYSLSARTLAPGAAVTSLNGFKDAVTLAAGNNVSITPNGNSLTIAAVIPPPIPTPMTSVNGLTGDVTLAAGNNVSITPNGNSLTIAAADPILPPMTSVNGLTGNVTLAAGDNVSITPNGNGLTIAAAIPTQVNGHALDALDGSPANALVVDANGNVGIGVSAPAALLDVNGSTQLRGHVGIGVNPNSVFPLTVRADVNTTLLSFQDLGGAGRWHLTYGGALNGLNFAETDVVNARLFLQDGGNVGIGTAQPSARLDVNGNAQVRGNLSVNGNISVANSVISNDHLDLWGNGTGGPDFIISSDGQAGFRHAYDNVGLNVRGRSPEAQMFRVELSNSDSVFQVQADRDVFVNGNFFVQNGVKLFIIDNPLNPAQESLRHNAVEGPGYYTFYHGNVVLDDKGEGWVQLPDYFEALNTEVSYNLTTVGGYAPVYVAQEVQGNKFLVAGGKAGLKVSWQVTANRNDPYAVQHPFEAVVTKTGIEQGHYYYPAGYGQPETMSVSQINPDQQPVDVSNAERGQ